MNLTLKTLAVAALMGTVSAPAFAAAHMSASMTCGEWMELSPEDRMTVAQMAIAEVHDGADGMSLEGDSKAVEDTGGTTTATEATDSTSEAGSVIAGESKAVEPTGGNTVASNMATEPMDEATMEEFMTICEQKLDAMVSEAAVGLDGTR